MTPPKEKAKELIEKFSVDYIIDYKCPLIVVEEIIKNNKNIQFFVSGKSLKDLDILNKEILESMLNNIEYWEEVKSEIRKIK